MCTAAGDDAEFCAQLRANVTVTFGLFGLSTCVCN